MSSALESKEESKRFIIEEIDEVDEEEAKGHLETKGEEADTSSSAPMIEEVDSTATAEPASEATASEAPTTQAATGTTHEDGSYTFEPLSFSPSYLGIPDLKGKATQWNLDGVFQIRRFRFHQKFDAKQADAFCADMLSSDAVRASFQVMGATKQWTPMAGKVRTVRTRRVPATVLSMEFWDRLQEEGIVTPTGYIRKCMEDVFEGVTVGDELRRMFVDEDSEFVDVYEDEEKEEFMFKLMKAIAIGGPLCQYDDNWDDYLKTTKSLYKDLLTVYKDSDTGDIRVSSYILEVQTSDSDTPLFPRENPHSFCYFIVDSLKRQATIFYGGFIPFW